MDAALTLILIYCAISAYHGLWKCQEVYLSNYTEATPEMNFLLIDSFLVALSVSMSILGYISEFFLLWLHEQVIPNAAASAAYQAMLILAYVADVTLFRAVWHLLDDYFLPENPLLSNLVCHYGGFFIIVIFGVANTLHGGVSRERYRIQDGIMITRFYLTYFFRRRTNTRSVKTQTKQDFKVITKNTKYPST